MRSILFLSFLIIISCSATGPNPGSSASLSKFQKDFLNKVNRLRTSGCKCGNTYMVPVKPLTWNKMLETAAYGHARDMERRKYFSHTSPSGKTIKNRIENAGYTFSGMRSYAVGENIASGQKSIDEVMKSWTRSESHCKNIMNRNFKEMGVAEVRLFWVQDFGMRLAN